MVLKNRMRKIRRKGRKVPRSLPMIRNRRINNTVHSFTRTFMQDTFLTIPNNSGGFGKGISFQLNGLPSASEFTTLFDQYRIKAIKWSLVPKQGLAVLNSVPSGPSLQAPIMPKIYSVVDYDDSSAPGSINELLQYQNVKITRANQIHSRYFKPAVATQVYQSATATGYGMAKNKWIDCANDTVPHYGIRLYVDGSSLDTPDWDFDVITKVYLQFKYVR